MRRRQEYPDDVRRIQLVLLQRLGVTVQPIEAEELWQEHSDTFSAGWLTLGDGNEIVSAYRTWRNTDES